MLTYTQTDLIPVAVTPWVCAIRPNHRGSVFPGRRMVRTLQSPVQPRCLLPESFIRLTQPDLLLRRPTRAFDAAQRKVSPMAFIRPYSPFPA